MKNKKGFIVPILLVIIAILVVGGGYYLYKDKEEVVLPLKDNSTVTQGTSSSQIQNTQQATPSDNKRLSDTEILSTLSATYNVNFQKTANGSYQGKFLDNPAGNVSVNSITIGDLNNDGLEDAVVHVTVCGGSCGSQFDAVINGPTTRDIRLLPDFTTVSAAQVSVKNISIDQGIISIKYVAPNRGDGAPTPEETRVYKLSGETLVRVN